MHHELDNADVLLKFHGRRFAGCANWHDAVHAAFHLQLYELFEGGFIQLPFGKRGNQCGINSTKHR